jgi:hypothetical protein
MKTGACRHFLAFARSFTSTAQERHNPKELPHMSLAIAVDRVTAVLLADGWHTVKDS